MMSLSASPVARKTESRGSSHSCQVCGSSSHGFHFQVESCRACAAFFRRSVERDEKYRCRRSTFDCDVKKDAPNCRFCRFERCKQVGMTTDGLKLPQKDSNFPDVVQSCCSSAQSDSGSSNAGFKDYANSYEFKADVKGQMIKIRNIIGTSKGAHGNPSPLHSLCDAFKKIVLVKNPKTPEIVDRLDFSAYMTDFNEFMERVAAWTMGSAEFAQLPHDDRWKMYCNVWPVVFGLERSFRTVEHFGRDCPPGLFLMMENKAVDMTTFRYVFADADEDKERAINAHFQPLNTVMLNYFIIPFKSLNLTTVEVVYLCAFKMFSVKKLQGLSPQTYAFANRIVDVLSDELHQYYSKELRTTNYAARISKMFLLMTGIESAFRYRNSTIISADLLKIYRCDYNDTEIYDSGRNF